MSTRGSDSRPPRDGVNTEDHEIYLEKLNDHRLVDQMQVRLRRDDSSEFWCAVSARVIDFHGSDVIIASHFDLTERREAEREIERQRAMLHQSEKLSALGELLAGISHELNNPLSIVMGQALLLQEKSSDEQAVQRAERISNAAERCTRIVKSFLALAHQEPREPAELDINDIIQEALELTSHALRRSSVDVELQLSNDLPRVAGDTDQLCQVFSNLIINARHALEEIAGERRLTVDTAYEQNASRVVARVTDNGPGVPSEISSRIFEPLFTTKKVGKGTGIGLALCHRIVQAHSGTIRLEKASAGGTTFAVALPPVKSAPPSPTEKDLPATEIGKLRVLVIADTPDVRDRLVAILAQDGYGTQALGSIVAALEHVKQQDYDAIFCDARLLGTEAADFCQSLQRARPRSVERLAFITDRSIKGQALHALDETDRPFIEAPFNRRDVIDVVDLLMRRSAR